MYNFISVSRERENVFRCDIDDVSEAQNSRFLKLIHNNSNTVNTHAIGTGEGLCECLLSACKEKK